MDSITHIIERQVFDLTLDTDREAQARQETARRVLREQVQPVLDEVFTRLAGPARVLRLDRLDLDLGVLSADDWAERLVERLREQVEQELRQHVHAVFDGEADGVSKTVMQSRLDAFMVFLDTGSLPWWVPDAASFDPGSVLLELIASQPEALRAALRSSYRSERARRLVWQVHSAGIEQLYTLLAPAATTLISQVLRAWQRLGEADLSATAGQRPSRTQVETAVLDLLLASSASATLTEKKLYEAIGNQMVAQGGAMEAVMQAVALLPETEGAALAASEAGPLVAWLREATATSSTAQAAYDKESTEAKTKGDPHARDKAAASAQPAPSSVQQQARRDATSEQPATGRSKTEHESEAVQHPASVSEAKIVEPYETEAASTQQEAWREADSERSLIQEPFESAESSSLEGQALYVTNAGLVVLWPFLRRFFKKMALVADRAFRTAALQQRAVLLTHYLVTGETEAPEQMLLLNKILCGWPPEASVPKAIDLTPAERDESQVLLEAAVTQWAALKNTSVMGLQQAFLQREGRLLKQPDAWTLKVDRTGYDVLLDRLPWSIAIVKQPWMPHPLFVEW